MFAIHLIVGNPSIQDVEDILRRGFEIALTCIEALRRSWAKSAPYREWFWQCILKMSWQCILATQRCLVACGVACMACLRHCWAKSAPYRERFWDTRCGKQLWNVLVWCGSVMRQML